MNILFMPNSQGLKWVRLLIGIGGALEVATCRQTAGNRIRTGRVCIRAEPINMAGGCEGITRGIG